MTYFVLTLKNCFAEQENVITLSTKRHFDYYSRGWYYGEDIVEGLNLFVWRLSPTPSGYITRGIVYKKYEPWSEEINLLFLILEVIYFLILQSLFLKY